jgi:hypothetical protein
MKIAGMDATFTGPTAVTGVKKAADEVVHVSFPVKKGDNLLPSGNTEEKEYPVTGKFIPEAVEKLNRMFEESSRRFEYSIHEKKRTPLLSG